MVKAVAMQKIAPLAVAVVPPPSRPKANLNKNGCPAKVDGEVKTLCMRYSQRTGCKNPSCRFAHLCPVKLPSGRICLGTHPAWQHQDTPH